jgi:hypothetical protein
LTDGQIGILDNQRGKSLPRYRNRVFAGREQERHKASILIGGGVPGKVRLSFFNFNSGPGDSSAVCIKDNALDGTAGNLGLRQCRGERESYQETSNKTWKQTAAGAK